MKNFLIIFEFIDSVQKNKYYLLNFSVNDNKFRSKISNNGIYKEKMTLGEIKIMGINIENIKHILVNNEEINKDQFYYNKTKCVSNKNFI